MPLIINGQRIEDALIDSEFSGIKAYHESLGNVSCCERDPEFQQMARDNITGRVLLVQEAGNTMPASSDAEIDESLAKLIDQYGGKEWFFMRTGANDEQMPLVRRDLDIDLRVRRMLDALADTGAQPSDAELRAYYEANIKAFLTTEEVRASHILKNPAGERRAAAFEELRQIRKQLQAGADFHETARQHSEKAEDSIDLGFFKPGELAPEFESVAFSLDVGEISPIFVTQYGMHVITVTERKPATPRPFDEIREEVRRHWWQQKRDDKTRELVDRLKQKAKIEVIDPELEAAAAMS